MIIEVVSIICINVICINVIDDLQTSYMTSLETIVENVVCVERKILGTTAERHKHDCTPKPDHYGTLLTVAPRGHRGRRKT
jgi:hypothetical protein